jgi:hypothetical protein
MGLPVGIPMSVSDVKDILNITSTVYDAFIAANLYPMAVYVNDYCNNGLAYDYEPTLTHFTTLTASSLSGTTAAVIQPWLTPPVVVFSSGNSKLYDEDHDYEVNYEDGSLVYLADSTNGTSTGGYALVHYSVIYPQGGAKVAISQLLRQQWDSNPNVLSESVGPLSRTYSGDLPRGIARLLRPYKKAKFV